MSADSGTDIDTVRAYWDARPCNIRHSDAEVGSREYFDQVEARKYLVEPHIPEFAQFSEWSGKKVLEIGCGIGTDAINFARAGSDYTGVELSEVTLNLARQRFTVFGLPGRLLLGNAEDIDVALPSETFDLIYSFGVLHHTPDPVRALASIRRLCHEDTRVKLMVYAANSYKAAMIRAGLDQPEAQAGCPVAFTYHREEFAELLRQTGFRVDSMQQAHVFPYVIEEYVQYRYIKQPWFESMPAPVFEALESEFGWHLLVEARPS